MKSATANTTESQAKPSEAVTSRTGRIVLAGGTGFLGKMLRREFSAARNEVVVFTRQPRSKGDIFWDGESLGAWASQLEGALAVINLAGKSVNCRYNERNRKLIMDSRTHSTRVLGEAIAKCQRPPLIWLNSSTATIYKHSIDLDRDETSREFGPTPQAKDAFSVSVAEAWEKTFEQARVGATRKVALRISMVLGTDEGTVFRVFSNLTRFGLGGRMGSGKQYVSWIHEVDFRRAINWIIAHENLEGPINLTAPSPVPNREMMQIFRRVWGMPIGLPATEWMLELGALVMGTETELILKSRRVVPRRLLESGFKFSFPKFEEAARDLEAKLKKGAVTV